MRSSNTYSRRAALVLVLVATCLLQARAAGAVRDPSCDDGSSSVSTCGFVLPDPENTPYCHDDSILALKRGCFVCVNATTCEVPDYTQSQVELSEPKSVEALDAEIDDEAIDAKPAEARMVPPELLILPIHDAVEHAESERGVRIHPRPDSVAASVPVSASAQSPAFREVSNWYFLVPAVLALISVGLALRGQMERTRQDFELVGEQAHDEINPFCGDDANPQDDDDDDDEDLEFGKQYNSDDSTDQTENDPAEL